MTVCRNRVRRSSASSGRGAAPVGAGVDRQVERVEPDAVRAEVDVGAADRGGTAAVFVFGVDDRDLHPLVEGAQGFELDQVGLARRRSGRG